MLRSLIVALGAARTAARYGARHRLTPSILAGVAIGVSGWCALHPFIASFGFHRASVCGLAVSLAIAFVAGLRSAGRWNILTTYAFAALVAAAWLVFLPSAIALAVATIGMASASWLIAEAAQFVAMTIAGLITFGVPAFCVGCITTRHVDHGDGPAFAAAAGLGVAATALLVAPWLGLQIPMLSIAGLTACVWLVAMWRGPSALWSQRSAASDDNIDAITVLRGVVSIGLIAAGLAATARVLAQLAPEAAYLVGSGIGSLLIGVATGIRVSNWLSPQAARPLAAATAACGLIVPLAAFSQLVEWQLTANAYVSSVAWLVTIRAGLVSAAILPLGIACGLFTASSCCSKSAQWLSVAAAVAFAAGCWLVPIVGVIPIALAVSIGLLVVNALPVVSLRPRSRVGWATTAGFAAILAAASLTVDRYEPVRAARLLFNTATFISHQHGVPVELLPHLDGTRLISSFETPRGTATLWKRNGEAFFLRMDGVPVASTSRQPTICPLPSADVMRIALPLILHDNPGSALILGDSLGLATGIATGFPLRHIVTYEPVSEQPRREAALLMPIDDRVVETPLDPKLALIVERGQYDVVVVDSGPPAVLASQPYFTQEFYVAAAKRLSADGIFCQRLQYADFGPEPLRVIAATMQRVFGDTMTVEVGSGEYVLLGTLRGSKLLRNDLVERLQRPQVRRTLASLGWDWSMPFNLPTVAQSGLEVLAKHAAATNTASNGWFAGTLPLESMRWGPKSQELNTATLGLATRIFSPGATREELDDIAQRIEEVNSQYELMHRYPDQPWAYRKEVKDSLTSKPRSVIQPVSGELKRVRHPDDQRRLDYFEALGKAIHDKTPESLSNLERFAAPYDPLITYFLHHEIAPLYAEHTTNQAAELAHRLYAAYFASPRDRSIRNVTTTIELIADRPELFLSDADRFDHLAGLLDVLTSRWQARGMATPSSPQVAIIDVDLSLDATEAALAAMKPLADSAGYSDDEWRLREAAIERTLTRPLRKYRASLLPHVRTAQQKAAATKAQ